MRRLAVLLPVISAFLVGAAPASSWTWPVEGPVLQPFNLGNDPYAAGQHRGVDIGSPTGTPVRAPSAGTVGFAGSMPRNGLTVTILTPDGYAVTLVHLGGASVSKGEDVAEGSVVGTVGPTGEPEHAEPYVHLGVRVAAEDNGYIDPLALLPALGPASEEQAGAPADPGDVSSGHPEGVPAEAAPPATGSLSDGEVAGDGGLGPSPATAEAAPPPPFIATEGAPSPAEEPSGDGAEDAEAAPPAQPQAIFQPDAEPAVVAPSTVPAATASTGAAAPAAPVGPTGAGSTTGPGAPPASATAQPEAETAPRSSTREPSHRQVGEPRGRTSHSERAVAPRDVRSGRRVRGDARAAAPANAPAMSAAPGALAAGVGEAGEREYEVGGWRPGWAIAAGVLAAALGLLWLWRRMRGASGPGLDSALTPSPRSPADDCSVVATTARATVPDLPPTAVQAEAPAMSFVILASSDDLARAA